MPSRSRRRRALERGSPDAGRGRNTTTVQVEHLSAACGPPTRGVQYASRFRRSWRVAAPRGPSRWSRIRRRACDRAPSRRATGPCSPSNGAEPLRPRRPDGGFSRIRRRWHRQPRGSIAASLGRDDARARAFGSGRRCGEPSPGAGVGGARRRAADGPDLACGSAWGATTPRSFTSSRSLPAGFQLSKPQRRNSGAGDSMDGVV